MITSLVAFLFSYCHTIKLSDDIQNKCGLVYMRKGYSRSEWEIERWSNVTKTSHKVYEAWKPVKHVDKVDFSSKEEQ